MQTLPFVFAVAVGVVGSGANSLAQEAPMHARDGGTWQRIESINIQPQTNAPFSAVVTTEWTRIMPDGSKQTISNHRTVARDSSGRVFQERRYFTPDGEKQVTRLSEMDYADPVRQELWVCRPDARFCTVRKFSPQLTIVSPKVGPLPNGTGEVTLESLGQKTLQGMDVVGSREVTTIKAGAIGNEKAQPIVKEFWYSPQLGINVETKRFDPRASAIQSFEVTGINLGEPDTKMFEPPADFRVVRMDDE